MHRLPDALEDKLLSVAKLLVNQTDARVVVSPSQPAPGFWFGGGNLTVDPSGSLILVGRYRNQGDSRVGLSAGARGCELALFRSTDDGKSFTKIMAFSKEDLSVEQLSPIVPASLPFNAGGTIGDNCSTLRNFRVLSIEGSCLHFGPEGLELFVSSEKEGIGYPTGYEEFLKAGCGVWTIDRLQATDIDRLKSARVEPLLASTDPEHLHVKDPHVHQNASGDLRLMFCTHPFCWSSSNTAVAMRLAGSTVFNAPRFNYFPRGTTWDVAISRGTCLINLPSIGSFRDVRVTLLFYDGGEALRNLDEHSGAVRRPRGYSCEELGGVAYFLNDDDSNIHRLSRNLPSSISPYGTGCSRYVDVLATRTNYYVTWQQSQPDHSQPLVLNVVSRGEVEDLLA